jgi:hypothetical protein
LPTYRLYRLDGAGKIVAAGWIEAADDDEAVREAQSQTTAAGGTFELWERNRLVARSRGGQR